MPSEPDTAESNGTPQESSQWGPKSQFRIFALGKNFDVEAYLETATDPLQFDDIWHSDPPHILNSGIEKAVGGDRLPIEDQERIASVFLEKHEQSLIDLARFPGVDRLYLGLYFRVELMLGWEFPITPDAGLMSLALKIGVQPVYYVHPVHLSSLPPS